MNIVSSWKTFQKTLEEDRQFVNLGLPNWWYVLFHYRGRLEDRLNLPYHVDLIQANLGNKKISFPLSFPYASVAKGILLEQEYSLKKVLSFEPQTILDLGANIGLGSLHLSYQFPQAKFVCVEPDPRNLSLLKQTINLNQIPAKIFDCAVGATTGEFKLRFDRNPTCSALETSPMHQLAKTVTVEVKTIPDILQQTDWEAIDLLKIDIEGVEDELLSINNSWLKKVKAIILEIHPNTSPEKILSYLKPYGFNLQRHRQGREPVYLATKS